MIGDHWRLRRLLRQGSGAAGVPSSSGLDRDHQVDSSVASGKEQPEEENGRLDPSVQETNGTMIPRGDAAARLAVLTKAACNNESSDDTLGGNQAKFFVTGRCIVATLHVKTPARTTSAPTACRVGARRESLWADPGVTEHPLQRIPSTIPQGNS